MADFTYRRVTQIRHEWTLPGASPGGWGVAIAEVFKAVASAENMYAEIFGHQPTYDDWLRVYASDDAVVLWFEEEVKGA
jgi:hypothetical protein